MAPAERQQWSVSWTSDSGLHLRKKKEALGWKQSRGEDGVLSDAGQLDTASFKNTGQLDTASVQCWMTGHVFVLKPDGRRMLLVKDWTTGHLTKGGLEFERPSDGCQALLVRQPLRAPEFATAASSQWKNCDGGKWSRSPSERSPGPETVKEAQKANFGLRRWMPPDAMSTTILTGITLLFLTTHGRPVCARALFLHDDASMCDGVRPCHQNVFDQIQCQVAQLNMSAQRLFETYLECQGPPFTENPDVFCATDRSFPPFVDETGEKKEMLLSLYKIFAFFNTSLGNITKDQENLGDDKAEKAVLMKHLHKAANVVRGLLTNLTCLLCSEYKVHRVDVTYGNSSGADIFQKKKHGCQVLRSYAKFIVHAATALGRCRKKQT